MEAKLVLESLMESKLLRVYSQSSSGVLNDCLVRTQWRNVVVGLNSSINKRKNYERTQFLDQKNRQKG